eukprot:3005461-Amphidinium_carterae.1
MRGERGKLRALMERADWQLSFTWSLPKIAVALLPKLERANARVEVLLHREQEAVEAEGLCRHEWAAMVHATWRRMVRTPAFTVASTQLRDHHNSQDEAMLLAHYWSMVFNKKEPDIPSTPLTDYVVHLPWHEVALTAEDLEGAVCRAATTTPGPDGISYGHLKPIAQHVGRVMHKVALAIMAGCEMPRTMVDSFSVFLNKKDAPVVEPRDTRPIVLDNVLSKIIHGAMASKLAPAFATVGHACQHGFVRGRTIPQAMLKLEEIAFRISMDRRFSALLFVDVKQAFPSLRRKWILEVCARSGATLAQLRIVRQMMRPNRTFIKWKGRVFAGYSISTGLAQGSPWSGLAFALAVDPFVRFAMDQIPWSIPVPRWVLFADDMVVGALHPKEFDVLAVAFVVLEDATGMAIGEKSKILPVGRASLTEFTR